MDLDGFTYFDQRCKVQLRHWIAEKQILCTRHRSSKEAGFRRYLWTSMRFLVQYAKPGEHKLALDMILATCALVENSLTMSHPEGRRMMYMRQLKMEEVDTLDRHELIKKFGEESEYNRKDRASRNQDVVQLNSLL